MSQVANAAVLPKSKGGKVPGSLLLDTFGLSPETMSPLEKRTAISGYDVRHRIEAMVAGITGKKIKHTYQGDGAATAPGMMILPRIVATSLFPVRHLRILLGYTAHEISHQLKTDFRLLTRLIDDKTIEPRRKQQIKEFWNAIEDYRIEKLVRFQYPGFHVYIDDTRDFSARRFCDRVDAGLFGEKELGNPYRLGAVALTWIGAELNCYVTKAPRDALNRLTPDHLAWIESWRGEMAGVQTCQDAYDLAVRVLDDLDQARGEDDEDDDGDGAGGSPGQQNEEGQSGSSGSKGSGKAGKSKDDGGSETNGPGDDSDGEEDDQGAGSGGGKQSSRSDADEGDVAPGGSTDEDDEDSGAGTGNCQGNAKGKDGEGDPTEGGPQQPGGSGKPRPRPKVKDGDEQCAPEAADLEIEELAKAINSMKGPEARDPKVTDEDALASMGAGSDQAKLTNIARGQTAYATIRRDVGAPAARAAGILRRLLQSTARRSWQGGREDGALDFGRVVGMIRGDADVYRNQVQRTSVNTALSLLLDNSGSMGGHPIRVCQQTAVVLDLAVQGTKTNIEITGFTGDPRKPVLYRYRGFGQKGQAASASLGNMDKVSLGGTPVSTPLMEAWRRLSLQKEPRRIMIVVSDGGAEGGDVEAARAAHDFIVGRGCAILGVAIGSDHLMRQWCTNVQSVTKIDELPIALTNLVKEALK